MSNKEGYPDRTAEIAIGRVAKQEKAMQRRKGGERANGNERRTQVKKGQTLRQHKT